MGATLDCTTGHVPVTITSSQYANLQMSSFDDDGMFHFLIPNAQIWHRSSNNAVGGDLSLIYLAINNIGFTVGLAFHSISVSFFYLVSHPQILALTSSMHTERYYSIFDTGRQRFGIAKTIYTDSNTNYIDAPRKIQDGCNHGVARYDHTPNGWHMWDTILQFKSLHTCDPLHHKKNFQTVLDQI